MKRSAMKRKPPVDRAEAQAGRMACLERDHYQCQALYGDRTDRDALPTDVAGALFEIRRVRCRRQVEAHHIRPAGMGGRRDHSLDNMVALCDEHHDWVHAHPKWAKLLGLLRGSS